MRRAIAPSEELCNGKSVTRITFRDALVTKNWEIEEWLEDKNGPRYPKTS